MKISYSWLKDYIKGTLPRPEKLAKILTLHAFEVKSLTKREGDYVLDIDVLPNRAKDCLSHIGIARECVTLVSLKFKIQNLKFKETKRLKINKFLKVEVEEKKLCLRYTARVITDVKVKDSSKRIQKRLLACGIKPINNIVDATNYVMLETGQPLHAFDFDKLEPVRRGLRQIIVRSAKKREKVTILDGSEYELDKDILVIADKKEPLAIAGIKGGKVAEIDKNTQNIVLESANFNPSVIRKASKKLGIKSDASRRFEAGLDPNLTDWALERVVALIQKETRGKVVGGAADIYPKKVRPSKIKLDFKRIEDLLGVEIPRQKIRDILKHLELKFKEHRFSLEVEIPTWRGDLNIQEDLIEELVRIYGYNKICSVMPEVQLAFSEKNISLFWKNKTKDILVGAGFNEVYNYSFTNSNIDITQIEVANPMNINQRYLRSSLIPNLLNNICRNLKYFNRFKIFELGRVYRQKDNRIQEKESLAGAVISDSPKTFYRAKGAVELLLNRLGIKDFQIQHPASSIQYWHPARAAQIMVGRKVLGTIGEIHPEIKDAYSINSRVILFELDFESLTELAKIYGVYKPVSRYPLITLDLAVIMDNNFSWASVKKQALKEGNKVVKNIELFDVYKGKGIPRDKISFAFHVIYQAEDRTLTEKEVKLVHEKIVKVLEKMGGEVRK